MNCSQLIAASKRYIYQHYSEPISLALLAEELGVSELPEQPVPQGNRRIYIKFLTRVRMEKAAELLRANRNIKMYEVAHQVGYFNAKHFNHVFKQWQGYRPTNTSCAFSANCRCKGEGNMPYTVLYSGPAARAGASRRQGERRAHCPAAPAARERRQTLLGFGGAFAEAAAYVSLLPEPAQEEFLGAYFDPGQGLGSRWGG